MVLKGNTIVRKSTVQLVRTKGLNKTACSINKMSKNSSLYFFLKGQVMRLESIMEHLERIISPASVTIRSYCEQLLRVSVGDLPDTVRYLVEELSSLVLESEVEKERQSLLTVALAINRELGKTQFSQEKNENSGAQIPPDNQDVSDDYIVCRICEERIPVEDMDEHTKACYSAYANASLVQMINEQLEVCRREIKEQYLSGPWPGEEKEALSTVLPFLHISTMLDKVINADVEGCDTTEDIE